MGVLIAEFVCSFCLFFICVFRHEKLPTLIEGLVLIVSMEFDFLRLIQQSDNCGVKKLRVQLEYQYLERRTVDMYFF